MVYEKPAYGQFRASDKIEYYVKKGKTDISMPVANNNISTPTFEVLPEVNQSVAMEQSEFKADNTLEYVPLDGQGLGNRRANYLALRHFNLNQEDIIIKSFISN